MLLPQLTSTAHTSSVVIHNTLIPSSTLLQSKTAILRRPRAHRQVRNFRIGLWSSYLDSEYQKEAQRRQRIMKQKYIEAFTRKLSWDRQPPVHIKHRGLKSFMCGTWNGHNKRPGGRWIDMEEVEALSARKNTEGGIEEVEQTPVDRLLKNHNDIIQDMIRTRARLFGSSWYEPDKSSRPNTNPTAVSSTSPQFKEAPVAAKGDHEKSAWGTNAAIEEYEIDPITNRKVLSKKISRKEDEPTRKQIDIPIQPFQQYRSQYQNMPSHYPADALRDSTKNYEREMNEKHKPEYHKTPEVGYSGKLCAVQAGLKEYDDKTSYGPVYYKEPDGKDAVKPCSVQQGLSQHDSKTSYGPVYYKEPDGKDPVIPCPVQQGLKEYDEKMVYGPVMYLEPDGKAPEVPCSVQEGLKNFDAKADYGSSKFGMLPESKRLRRPPPEDRIEDLDLLRASDIRAAAGTSKAPKRETDAEKATKRRQLEVEFRANRKRFLDDLRIEHSEISNHVAHARGKVNAKIAEVEAGWTNPTSDRKMTGNFNRDFPEEINTTWTAASSKSGTLVPNTGDLWNNNTQKTENKVPSVEASCSSDLSENGVSGQGPGTERIQPSLNRSQSSPPKAPASKSVEKKETVPSETESRITKNLEKQKHTDLVREVRQIYEDTYGTIDCNHRQVPNKQPPSTKHVEVTTIYKILAYDPTMQSISEAETTSIVPDSASPLTPAEVLLRLSNPAKFFPHFAPLQSQGYEIVSGSGDVLVFRKVRSEAPSAASPTIEPTFASKEYTRLRRNPIDGMQPVPATGNFASPTGFVNHDLPEDRELSEPPFKSNIDVRREETVFSGKPNWQESEQTSSRKRKGRGKRFLVGAMWVAGCSYAVGVVAEFFKTGGVDGLGPKGF